MASLLRFLSLISSSLFFFLSYSAESQKVSLALYYETLCPYCSRFMVNKLPILFEKDLISIVDLKLVPYGNAKIDGNGNIVCQHGEYECLLNTVEACAIHIWPELNKHFTFIYCIENLVKQGKSKEWESCFAKMGLNSKPIQNCFNSGLGKQLELQYANETAKLQPPHTYVPWLVVDNEPLLEDYENFVSYVCKAYKGIALPKACREPTLGIIPKAKENLFREACYKEDETSHTSPATGRTKIRTRVNSWRRQMMATSM